MKTKSLLVALLSLTLAAAAFAEKIVAGPKGGRLLDTQPNKAEFFVTPDRKLEITFYDAQLKPIAAGAQTVTVIAEPSSGRTPVPLDSTSTGFVSKNPLPGGDPYRVVVQARPAADAKPTNFRIDLNLETCGGCQRSEYACSCHE